MTGADPDGLVHSYLFMRRGIGVIGIALPFVLTAGYALSVHRAVVLDSISAYYYTGMRDVFVGSMSAIGVFLICYRYQRLDDVLSTLAGVLAILVALFPTAPHGATGYAAIIGVCHYVFAGGLLILLAGFCLVLFPRTDPRRRPTPRKQQRNALYRICGTIILVSLAVATAGRTLLASSVPDSIPLLLWCESVAVVAFGISWLVKGETLLRDQDAGDDRRDDVRPAPPQTPRIRPYDASMNRRSTMIVRRFSAGRAPTAPGLP